MANECTITGMKAREIIDCRGTPTVQVDVWVNGALHGRADVPSGRSTGSYEAFEMRDGGSRYGGFGVSRAVENVNSIIAPAFLERDVTEQRSIDMDLATRSALEPTPYSVFHSRWREQQHRSSASPSTDI